MDILESEFEAITGFDKEIRSHALPIWFESLVGIDWTLLHLSPVYYGFGVAQGDGSPTIVVPGFLGSDLYLYELHFWLSRIGYKSYLSNIGWNADCLDTLSEKLISTIKKAHKETGKKVNLIGHSLGGVLSRSAAVQHPELVESVITLASPFRGVKSHPRVLEIREKIRTRIFQNEDKTDFPHCFTGHCDCAAVKALHDGLPKDMKQNRYLHKNQTGSFDWNNCLSRNEAKQLRSNGYARWG